MPPGAVAVILLLNGLQIAMPQPAFVLEGRAWIPARAVLAAAGWQVGYDPARDLMLLDGGPGPSAQIHANRPQATVNGQTKTFSAPPRRVGDTLFLPADAFSLLGMSPQWHPDTRAVHLQTPQPTVAVVSVSELKTDPFAYLERRVTVAGEYLGARSEEPGTWLLRDRRDIIVCREAVDSGRPSLARAHTPLQYGARLTVTARVRMSSNASLWLDILESRPTSGPPGITCIITTARDTYRPGQVVLVELQVANLTAAPVHLQPDAGARLIIADPTDRRVWTRQLQLPQTIPPGYQATQPYLYTLTEDLPDGRYTLQLQAGGTELWAAEWCFTQVSGPQQPKRELEP